MKEATATEIKDYFDTNDVYDISKALLKKMSYSIMQVFLVILKQVKKLITIEIKMILK